VIKRAQSVDDAAASDFVKLLMKHGANPMLTSLPLEASPWLTAREKKLKMCVAAMRTGGQRYVSDNMFTARCHFSIKLKSC
jgi:hypothetical protein